MESQTKPDALKLDEIPVSIEVNGDYHLLCDLLQKIHERMVWMVNEFGKVMFIRFDLRFPANWQDKSNDQISHLFKIIKDHYRYHGIDMMLVWLREENGRHGHFYRCILLIDGNKVIDYMSVLDAVSLAWRRLIDCSSSLVVDYCNRDNFGNPIENGIMICRPSAHPEQDEYEIQNGKYQRDFAKCFKMAASLVNDHTHMIPGQRGIHSFHISKIKRSSG